jgi:hypothetical protein
MDRYDSGSSVYAMFGHGGCAFTWANEGLAQACGRRALDMRPPTYTGDPGEGHVHELEEVDAEFSA